MTVFDKDEASDLNPKEKKALKTAIEGELAARAARRDNRNRRSAQTITGRSPFCKTIYKFYFPLKQSSSLDTNFGAWPLTICCASGTKPRRQPIKRR